MTGRKEHLRAILRKLGSVAVAFSGGVDSTLLLAASLEALGSNRVMAVLAVSPIHMAREREEAVAVASQLGARLRVIETDELEDPRFVANPPDRCYYCKASLLDAIRALADEEGLRRVIHGATVDDLGDHRPGMQAAEERGTRAPLLEAGFTKADVRALSRKMGLPTWDRPSQACLASRFPYGTPLTCQGLARVERAEEFLRKELGLNQLRVRDHGNVARLEVPVEELPRLTKDAVRQHIVEHLKGLGYTYVTLDLAGFRSGSMNEALSQSSLRPGSDHWGRR